MSLCCSAGQGSQVLRSGGWLAAIAAHVLIGGVRLMHACGADNLWLFENIATESYMV